VTELIRRFEARTGTGVSPELFTRFRDQSGVQVTVENVDSGGIQELLETPGSNIHLFAQDNGDLAGLIDNELVQKFPKVEIDGKLTMEAGGSGMFLPFRPNVRLSYANEEKLAEAGVESPDGIGQLPMVATALRDLDENNRLPRVTLSLSDADGGAPAAVTISELILSFGGNPRVLDSEEAIKAFEFLRTLFGDGLLARQSFLAKHDTEVDYLMEGTVFLAQNWSVTSATLEKAGMLDQFTVHPGWQERHVVGGDVLGIPAEVTGKERDAAAALAEFLMSKEAQRFLVERNAWPAIRNDAYEGLPRSATIIALEEALRDGWYRPTEAFWAEVVKAMNEAVHRIVLSNEPAGTVLQELQARVAQTTGYQSQ
ncbi:MAG: extracellular solute-binding protein, partial [Acidimicrobiia bacterium]